VNNAGTEKDFESINASLAELRKKLSEVDDREQKDYKSLLDELNNLKQQLKSFKTEKIDSKTSLDE